MIAVIIILAIGGLVCLPQGGENVWYGLIALAAAAVLLIIKIAKSKDNASQEPFSPIQITKTEPIKRDKNLIPDGYFTDINGIRFPVSSICCPYDPDGLNRIDNNYYEITSDQNIQKAKSLILSLNSCLDEANATRSGFPEHRFSSYRLRFKFDPYAGTRNYCTLSFKNIAYKKSPAKYKCCLFIAYTDDLFGEVLYDQNGIFESATLTIWRKHSSEYPNRVINSGVCYIVKIVPSPSGTPVLESVKTTQEKERERLQKSNSWATVHNKWQAVIDDHNRLIGEIGVAYTIANNLNLPNSPQMEHVIDLCNQDIALAEMFIKSQLEIQDVRIANGWSEQKAISDALPNFPTFKRLAIIYEKQKKYDEAIAVCQRAIELGLIDDGTDGQMPGRLARLMKKKCKDVCKIEPAEEIIIEDT